MRTAANHVKTVTSKHPPFAFLTETESSFNHAPIPGFQSQTTYCFISVQENATQMLHELYRVVIMPTNTSIDCVKYLYKYATITYTRICYTGDNQNGCQKRHFKG